MKVFAQDVLPTINPSDLPGRSFGDLETLLAFAVQRLVLPILAGLALLYLVWAGYQFFTSAGDADRIAKARRNMTYAVVGVILTVLAYALVGALSDLIQRSAGGL